LDVAQARATNQGPRRAFDFFPEFEINDVCRVFQAMEALLARGQCFGGLGRMEARAGIEAPAGSELKQPFRHGKPCCQGEGEMYFCGRKRRHAASAKWKVYQRRKSAK